MAKETAIELWRATDFSYEYTIKNAAESQCINISGWALSWMIKRRKSDLDASALLVKTTAVGGIAIAGVFNVDPALNAQVATVTIADTDTTTIAEGLHYWELKRTDDGFETVLAYGRIDLRRPVHA